MPGLWTECLRNLISNRSVKENSTLNVSYEVSKLVMGDFSENINPKGPDVFTSPKFSRN